MSIKIAEVKRTEVPPLLSARGAAVVVQVKHVSPKHADAERQRDYAERATEHGLRHRNLETRVSHHVRAPCGDDACASSRTRLARCAPCARASCAPWASRARADADARSRSRARSQ